VVHPWQPACPAAGGVLLVPPSDMGRTVLVHEGGVSWVPSSELTVVRELDGFADGTGWYAVDDLAEMDWTPVVGADPRPAIAAAHRALAAEIAGVCDAALTLVLAHTTNRRQYGRPIASFQAVRHRLAEAHVAAAAAQDVLDVAVVSAGRNDASGWAARIAKITAGRAQADIMRSAVQFFGALGVTQESAVHRYVSRAATLDALHGGHRHLTEQLGRELLDGAALEPVAGI
jgi:alkylation response protein AidB-like acyl-CoA dehydrogenase